MAYRQPRRFNVVSMGMLLLLAAGVYWLYCFFPVYWDAWTVDHCLHEGAAAMYQANKLVEPDRSTEMRKILLKVQADCIRLAHITDPTFDPSLELAGDSATLTGDYNVLVRHPVGDWVTNVHMHRVEKANIKQVHWE
jgi:hypothetical protein